MKALIIIACVIGYLIMWVVTGVIATRELDDSPVFIGLFWPISLPAYGISAVIELIDDWLTEREISKRQKELEERK